MSGATSVEIPLRESEEVLASSPHSPPHFLTISPQLLTSSPPHYLTSSPRHHLQVIEIPFSELPDGEEVLTILVQVIPPPLLLLAI